MKKQLLFLCIAIAAIEMQSQNAIPNPDFELWTENSIEMPKYLPFSSNLDFYWHDLPLNVVKTQPGYHGQYAVKLETRERNIGYLLNTDPGEGGDPAHWKRGMAFTERATGVRGYYKYNTPTGDAGMVMFVFRKNGAAVGTYQYLLNGSVTDFTLFEHTFSPALTEDPDSLIVAYASSYNYASGNTVVGSALILDSISLKGVTAQPTQLNGDFEEWENVLLTTTLDNWNEVTKGDDGISRSTDAKTGQYALKLTTYLGEQNNLPSAQPGYLTLGYWDDICGCSQGGMPYALTKDTLAFWYKYTPQGNDQAQVYLEFRQNGNQIGGEYRNLDAASSSYQYVEIPFQLGVVPDHVIIQAISSQWQNRSLSYVGSTLLLDNMFFKSSITGFAENVFKDKITLSPNPVKGLLNINTSDVSIKSIDLYDIAGKKIFTTLSRVSNIDVSALTGGVYFVRIDTGKQLLNYKIIKL